MKRVIGWGLVLLLLASGLALPWLLLDDSPTVEPPTPFSRQDIFWAQNLFQKNDPRLGTPGVIQSLSLGTDEVNRLLNYAVAIKPISGMEAEIYPEGAIVSASLKLPHTPFGSYLNISIELLSNAGQLDVSYVQIGSLPLPGILARWASHLADWALSRDATYTAITRSIHRINFNEDRATLDYEWQPQLLTQLQRKSAALLISDEDRTRLLVYAEFIRHQVNPLPQGARLPLHRLIRPVFALAKARSGDAVAENRTAMTALAAYVSGVSLPKLLKGEGKTIRREPPVLPSLHGRQDFAQHYLIAAALAANGGSRLANALGLAKEEDDAQHGSGFSFTDLAADRAAARLGERLIGATAANTQQMLAQATNDTDLMPDFSDLPEFMPAGEFTRRFGGVGSMHYQAVVHGIDKRLAFHPLLGHAALPETTDARNLSDSAHIVSSSKE